MKSFLKIIAVILFVGTPLVIRQLSAQQPEQPPLKRTSQAVMIGPDDMLDIIAINLDKITKQWRVGASGDLNLPMFGQVHAAGKTVGELEAELTVLAGKYVREPHVSVHLVELHSQPVSVQGAV